MGHMVITYLENSRTTTKPLDGIGLLQRAIEVSSRNENVDDAARKIGEIVIEQLEAQKEFVKDGELYVPKSHYSLAEDNW